MAVTAAEIAIAIKARDDATRALTAVRSALAGLGAQAQSTTRAVATSGQQMATAARQVEAVRAAADSGGLSFGKLAGGVALGTVAANAFMGALGAIGGAVSGAISGTLAFSSTLEQTQVGFTQMLGSGEKARAFMQQLRDFAVSTPFDFPQLADAAKRLMAMGFQAENVIPLMTDVGNAVSAIGGGTPELNRVILALGQIQAKGKVSAEEMNQLAELGISGWKMLSAATGKTTAELMKMAEAGQISADVFLDAFHKFASANFGGMMEAQSRTMQGALSNIRDGFGNFLATGLEPFYNAIRDGAVIVADALGSPAVKQFGADVRATMQDVVTALAPVGNAFRQAFESLKAGDVMGFVGGLVDTVRSFAQGMFGAGYTLVETFASGISSAIGAAISAVAELVASIAAFLVGQSPPPEGPLSEIDAAGARLIETYVGGMASADLAPLAEVTERIGSSFDAAFRPDLLASAQQAFRDSAGSLAAMKDNAADVEGALKAIEMASRDVERAISDARDQIADIKDRYDEQLDSLHAQLDAINDVNDALQEQQDIQEKIAALELDKQINAAKGDPTARADIRNKQDEIRFQKEEIQQRIRQLQLDGGKKQNQKEIERLQSQLLELDKKELELKKQEAALTDRAKLAELQKQKEINRAREDEQRILSEQAKLQKDLAALPIKQRIKEIEAARKAELKPLEDQVKVLERQKRLLQEQRQEYQDLKKDIAEAVKALEPKKAGGGGGGGGGAAIPKPGGAVLPKLDIDMTKAGELMGQSMATGIEKWFQANGASIIGGAIGGAVGLITFGPIGAVIGAGLGSAIGRALQEKIPDLGKRVQDALQIVADSFETIRQVFAREWAPDPEQVHPFTEAVGELALKVRDDVIPAIETFGNTVGRVGTAVAGVITATFKELVRFGTEIAPLVDRAWANISSIVSAGLTTIENMLNLKFSSMTIDWGEFWSSLGSLLDGAWQTYKQLVEVWWTIVQTYIKTGLLVLAGDWSAAWETMRGGLAEAWGKYAQLVESNWDAITRTISARTQAALVAIGLWAAQMLLKLADLSADAYTKAAEIGQSIVDGIRNGIRDGWEALKRFVEQKARQLLDAAKAAIGLSESSKKSEGETSGERALGGPVQAGRSYLVGERGPELFRPLYNGFIVPNNRLAGAGAGGGGISLTVTDGVSPRRARQLFAAFTSEAERRKTSLDRLGIS